MEKLLTELRVFIPFAVIQVCAQKVVIAPQN